jgi:hypothetical protein
MLTRVKGERAQEAARPKTEQQPKITVTAPTIVKF